MTVLVLLGVLALAVGGCVCAVWAERGEPRLVRGVAKVTLTAGELLRRSEKNRRRGLNRSSGDGDRGMCVRPAKPTCTTPLACSNSRRSPFTRPSPENHAVQYKERTWLPE
ncbi:hypothetical protein ABZ471_35955 [Streptomyces sp. NPDC005728]|uniref:hypothetical protein n=1 Tax=Streptomyces sp. NPDC005728 TaxID=3157054 RepID=UPI0033CE426F